jgi:hypothetical protein
VLARGPLHDSDRVPALYRGGDVMAETHQWVPCIAGRVGLCCGCIHERRLADSASVVNVYFAEIAFSFCCVVAA